MKTKKFLSVLINLSLISSTIQPALLAGPRDDNRYFSYQSEISQAVYNPGKDVSHPSYELNQMIETQKQSKQLELNLRQVLRDQRPVLSEGQSMFTPVPIPKAPELKPRVPSVHQNTQNSPVAIPDQIKPTSLLSAVIPASPKENLAPLARGSKNFISIAIKSFVQAIGKAVNYAWQAIKIPFTAVVNTFKAFFSPPSNIPSAQQTQDYKQSLTTRYESAQAKITSHQENYSKLREKIVKINHHGEVLKNEYQRLGVFDPIIGNAIDRLGQTEPIGKLAIPLHSLGELSQEIAKALSNHNFPGAEKLLHDFDQSEKIYSKQATSLTRDVNKKTAVLLQLIKHVGNVVNTPDPQANPQPTMEAYDFLNRALKERLIDTQDYVPLYVGLIRSLPNQMAEAEHIRVRENFLKTIKNFYDIKEGAVKGPFAKEQNRYTMAGYLLSYLLAIEVPAWGYALMARDTAASGYTMYVTNGREGKLDTLLGVVPVLGTYAWAKQTLVKMRLHIPRQLANESGAIKVFKGTKVTNFVRKSLPPLRKDYAREFDGAIQIKTFRAGKQIHRSPWVPDEKIADPGNWFTTRKTVTVKGTESQINAKKWNNPLKILRTYEFTEDVTVYYGKVANGKGYQVLFPDDVDPGRVLKYVGESKLK